MLMGVWIILWTTMVSKIYISCRLTISIKFPRLRIRLLTSLLYSNLSILPIIKHDHIDFTPLISFIICLQHANNTYRVSNFSARTSLIFAINSRNKLSKLIHHKISFHLKIISPVLLLNCSPYILLKIFSKKSHHLAFHNHLLTKNKLNLLQFVLHSQ